MTNQKPKENEPKRRPGRPKKPEILKRLDEPFDPDKENLLYKAKQRFQHAQKELAELEKGMKELEQKKKKVVKEQEEFERAYRRGVGELVVKADNVAFRPTTEQVRIVELTWDLIRQGMFPDTKLIAHYSNKMRAQEKKDRLAKLKPGSEAYKKEKAKKARVYPTARTIRSWFEKTHGFRDWFIKEALNLCEIPEPIERQAFVATLRKHVSEGSIPHMKMLMDLKGWAPAKEHNIHLETKQKTLNYNELTQAEKELVEKQRAIQAYQTGDLRIEDEDSITQGIIEGKIDLDDDDDYDDDYEGEE